MVGSAAAVARAAFMEAPGEAKRLSNRFPPHILTPALLFVGHQTLQDSKLPSLFPRKFYLDLVDDDWIADTLSDDGARRGRIASVVADTPDLTYAANAVGHTTEIDIPPGLDIDLHAAESPSGEPPAPGGEDKVDRWNDLGLDMWARDAA